MDDRPDIDQASYTVRSYGPRSNGAGAPRSSQATAAPGEVYVSECHAKLPKIQSAAYLQKREFPEIRYVVPGIIAPGLTRLLTSRRSERAGSVRRSGGCW
jgi:hypothetical protein